MRAGSLLWLCSELLHNSPVTKLCKPFYLLNAAFQTLLSDHSPCFSHNAIATSRIQATSYSSSNTLSPAAASSLKSHKYCFGLYQTFTTQPVYPISPQFNTFNPLISDPFNHFFHCLLAHFAPHLCPQPQWFSSFPYKRKQNSHLVLLVEFFKTQTPIPYIRNLSWQTGKVVFKEKIKILVLGGEILYSFSISFPNW